MKLLKRILCLAIVLATMMSMVLLPIPASAADAEMEVIGAAITIRDGAEGTRALRFVARVKKESTSYTLTYGNSANFGLILLPQYMVNSGVSISTSTANVLTIPAKLAMEYNHPWIVEHVAEGSRSSAYVYFVATIKDIPTNQYKTNFLARVYVNSTCSTQVTRSVFTVASALNMTSIVNTANSYGTDIVVDVGNVN